MNTSWIRNYLVIVLFGVLHVSAVSAQVSTTTIGWNDLAPDVQSWLITQTNNVIAMRTEIATLTATVATLQASLSNNTTSIATNASDIDGLEVSSVPNLGTYLRIGTHNSKPAVIFEAANVLVLDGTGSTEGTPTGLGNLMVGYDENDGSDVKTGSHNLVVGPLHTYNSYGGFVAGYNNNVTGIFASVNGGQSNTASADYASVSGGSFGTASGLRSSVSGGAGNTASGDYSSVSGGNNNTASGSFSSTSGGYGSTALNFFSSVSGGYNNTASGQYSSVSGGEGNTASGNRSSVSGGNNREASGTYDWAAGSLSEDL